MVGIIWIVESSSFDFWKLHFKRKWNEFKFYTISGLQMNVDDENSHHIILRPCSWKVTYFTSLPDFLNPYKGMDEKGKLCQK